MPDRPQSIGPPVVDPARWEDFAAFRETFLLHYTHREHNTALRALGAMLFEMALEAPPGPLFPDLPGLHTRHELAAVAADLRHLQGFLRMVGDEQHDDPSDLGREKVRLSRLAARLVPHLGRMAETVEVALGIERNHEAYP